MREMLVLAVLAVATPALADPPETFDFRPDGKGAVPRGQSHSGQAPGPKAKPGTFANGIGYHGGPVITGTTSVYYIWYGDWSGNDASTILTPFAQGIGGSPYFNINTTYYQQDSSGVRTFVSNSVSYSTAATCTSADTNGCWKGTALGPDSDVLAIVTAEINDGKLPADAHAVYFVLTAPDVTKNGFCSLYCGWHTHATIAGADIKYAFIGDAATQCPSGCLAQTTSPNGNAGADGMASVIAHELEESVTDPDLNAWYDRRGQENADKCAWTFGTGVWTESNGSKANVKLGSNDYYIQQNWVNASGGYCAMKYP